MTMPLQKPGKSKQDYGTPWALIHAVEARWGKLGIDLAASNENTKAAFYFDVNNDFLTQDFTSMKGLPDNTLCWLNPPFENLGPWMAKCRLDAEKGARIIMLVPASIGAEWFATYAEGCAKVIGLRPRITFEGCKDPYPKDCMLLLWGDFPADKSFSTWRWKP